MFDRAAIGSSGGGFIWHVRGHDRFVGLKQSRNGCRSGARRGHATSGALKSGTQLTIARCSPPNPSD